ncbi:MAG TPA: hypothetical protein VGR11_14610 [Solirubrobacteraceae bacterium]|nr:hypothetical protein [Solirubrobacteraceae bacterium]
MGRFGVPVGFLRRTARGVRATLPLLVSVLTLGLGMWAAYLIVFRRTRARRDLTAAVFHLVTTGVACVLITTDVGAFALLWIMLVNYVGGGAVLGARLYPDSAPSHPPLCDDQCTQPPLEPWTRAWVRRRVSLWWQALLIIPFGFGSALALLFAGALARRPGWWALIPLHLVAALGAVALIRMGYDDASAIAFLGGLALGTATWLAGTLQVVALSPHYLLRRRALRARQVMPAG